MICKTLSNKFYNKNILESNFSIFETSYQFSMLLKIEWKWRKKKVLWLATNTYLTWVGGVGIPILLLLIFLSPINLIFDVPPNYIFYPIILFDFLPSNFSFKKNQRNFTSSNLWIQFSLFFYVILKLPSYNKKDFSSILWQIK